MNDSVFGFDFEILRPELSEFADDGERALKSFHEKDYSACMLFIYRMNALAVKIICKRNNIETENLNIDELIKKLNDKKIYNVHFRTLMEIMEISRNTAPDEMICYVYIPAIYGLCLWIKKERLNDKNQSQKVLTQNSHVDSHNNASVKNVPVKSISDDEFLDLCSSGTPDEIANAIKNNANPSAKNPDGKTALMLAARHNSSPVDAMKIILRAGADINTQDKEGWTALMNAARYRDNRTVKYLISAGADVNILNKDLWTALMLAVRYNEYDLLQVIETLIAAGSNVNAQSNKGWNALMIAARYQTPEVVNLLLKAKSDINAKSSYGSTALMIASESHNLSVVNILNAAGSNSVKIADIVQNADSVKNILKNNNNDEVVKEPVKKDSAEIKNENANAVEHVQKISPITNNDNKNNNEPKNFLDLCKTGTPDEIQNAINNGADINIKTSYDGTALMIAAANNSVEAVKILLAAGADVRARAKDGWTALMEAASNNNADVVNALLDAGADVNVEDMTGKKAIDFALDNERLRFTEALERLEKMS